MNKSELSIFIISFLTGFIINLLLNVCGCFPKHYPLKEETIYTYKDSTVVNTVDTIKVVKDIVPVFDTLYLSTSLTEI